MEPRPAADRGELGFAVWHGEPVRMSRSHVHHDFELNLVMRGSVTYLIGGRRVRLAAPRAYLFWASIPHHLLAGEEAYLGWIVLPVEWLWRWGLDEATRGAMLGGAVMAERSPEPGDGETLERWAATLERRERAWDRVVELEVEARLRRMILQGLEPVPALGWDAGGAAEDRMPRPAAAGESATLATVEAMAAFMTRRFRDDLSVADVADHVSLHPNYAMRLFRRHMGMTLIDYLTRQRVAEAQRRLLISDGPVLNIAFDCGFGSASRFHDAFRRTTGTTPGAFRRGESG